MEPQPITRKNKPMDASVVMCVVHGVSAAVHVVVVSLKPIPIVISRLAPSFVPLPGAMPGKKHDLEPLRQPLPAALLLLIQH